MDSEPRTVSRISSKGHWPRSPASTSHHRPPASQSTRTGRVPASLPETPQTAADVRVKSSHPGRVPAREKASGKRRKASDGLTTARGDGFSHRRRSKTSLWEHLSGTAPGTGHRAPSGPGGCLGGRGAEPPAPPEEAQQSLPRWPCCRDLGSPQIPKAELGQPRPELPGRFPAYLLQLLPAPGAESRAAGPRAWGGARPGPRLLSMALGCHWCASLRCPNPTSDRWPLRPPSTSFPSHSHAAPSLPLLGPSTLGPPDASLPLTAPHWPLSQPAGCTIEMYLEFTCVSLSPPPPSWSRLHDVSLD